MKIAKKVIAVLCVFGLLLPSVLALGPTDANMSDEVNVIGLTQAQMQDIAQSLRSAMQTKSDFGLENVDFNSLMLGSEIPTFEYTVTGFNQLDFSFIPVFSEDILIALVVKDGTGRSAITKQIGTALVRELNDADICLETLAIIYDADGCHAYNGVSTTLLVKSEDSDPTRSTMSEVELSSNNSIFCSDFDSRVSINLYSCLDDVDTEAFPTHIIRLSFVSQEPETYRNLCWAACMSMIGKYHTGISKSIVEIARSVYNNGDFDFGAESYQIIPKYEELYSLFVSSETDPYRIDEAWIRSFIYDDIPLHTNFINVDLDNQYHATVIYGIAGNGESIVIRDPQEGTYYGYFDSREDKIVYTTYYSGYKMVLDYVIYDDE